MSTANIKLVGKILRDSNIHVDDLATTEEVITFTACCIGHANDLHDIFRIQEFLFVQEDCKFMIVKNPEQPKIIGVTSLNGIYDIWFDRDVYEWCSKYFPDEEAGQNLVDRVLKGIFGTQNKRYRVDWISPTELRIMEL